MTGCFQLFPPGISSRTDSYNPLTGTPDRLTFFFTWTSMRLTGHVMVLPSVLLGALLLTDVFLVGEVDAVGLLELGHVGEDHAVALF